MKRIIFFLITFLIFLKPQTVFAETIRSFSTDITANKNGVMNIKEVIKYDFENSEKHGIYRYIPLYSKVGDLYRIIKVSYISVSKDGQEEKFSTSQNNDQIEIKIGDADKTITGLHEYQIVYTVENGIGSNFSTHDEIYWNATGNGWTIPIQKADISITTDFQAEQTGFICFTGLLGSKESNCTVSGSSASADNLPPASGLTAVASFPVGTFPKSILSKEAPENFGDEFFMIFVFGYCIFFAILNIILPKYLIYWYQKKKNKKRFGSPAVNFDIPKDEKGERLAPALAGTIDNSILDRNDVAATIFDLAIRKYIKLEQTKKPKKVLGIEFGGEQTAVKLKNADHSLNSFEKSLFNRLFRDGDTVMFSDLRKDFYKTYNQMEKDVFKILVDKKYYTKNPKNQKALLIVGTFFAFFTGNIILAGILLFLGIKLNGRTASGDEIDFKIDGLKLFLKSMDRNYKWQAEQLYVVEQMIPYAMALGYIEKFMKQLETVRPDYKPTWYHGYTPFYLGYAGFYSAASTITSAPSSSSGAGGGGFSGGGGGGGGGGSW